MASMNRVILCGNLGNDPDLRYTQTQQAVATFSVATTERWTDQGGQKQEETTWHRVVAWGKMGENCSKYLKKGSPVLVEGRIKTNTWEDKEGNKRYGTDIVANNVQFLSSGEGKGDRAPHPAGSSEAPAKQPQGQKQQQQAPRNDAPVDVFTGHPSLDDIPF